MRISFNNFRVKTIIASIIMAIIVCSTLYWYFGYHIKTPEYALKMISESINKHDLAEFNKYVDRKELLSGMADDIIADIIQSDQQTTDNTAFALQEYSSIFKTAFLKNLDTALTKFVSSEKWSDDTASSADEDTASYMSLLENAGLIDLSVNDYKIISVDKSAKTATLAVDTTQNEIAKTFTFKIILLQQDNGRWMVTKIENYSEFLSMLSTERKKYMLSYVEKTDALMNEHKKTFNNIDSQLQEIISSGNIGSNSVRDDLKKIMNDNMLPHWHMLKEALAAINPPKSAETLQRLRLQICDYYIAYYENYIKWLDDKNIKSLRDANDSLKRAKILETNENNLTNIIKRDLSK
ncbi:hypothetical protein [Pectinatus haikarae]|uniref:hypothetical protein n=1 Tax=Pectinatus haikarae TaxID=349096 RepID=UPI0018C5ABAF|nr:hypothetical protein [Pectinatus haikarae]